MMTRALILGYGNPLRGDDALGVLAAERLRALLPEAEVFTNHQLTPELAAALSQSDAAVFLVAAAMGTPGTVSVTRLAPLPSAASLTHQVSPQALLELAQSLYGHAPRAYLITGVGESFSPQAPPATSHEPEEPETSNSSSEELDAELTPAAHVALEKICRLVPELLANFPALW
jgi:hydrogenase maturation protease